MISLLVVIKDFSFSCPAWLLGFVHFHVAVKTWQPGLWEIMQDIYGSVFNGTKAHDYLCELVSKHPL